MKTFGLILLSALLFFGNSTAQNKELKKEVNQEVVSLSLGELVKSKNFEFVVNTAMPLGQPSINLVGNEYSVVFSAEKIVSDLPYFGVATRFAGLERDKGMRFEGEPIDFKVVDLRNGYRVKATIKTDRDRFTLSLEIGNSGYATLTIDSKNRELISYQGEVRRLR